jgi:hypothetical protein
MRSNQGKRKVRWQSVDFDALYEKSGQWNADLPEPKSGRVKSKAKTKSLKGDKHE